MKKAIIILMGIIIYSQDLSSQTLSKDSLPYVNARLMTTAYKLSSEQRSKLLSVLIGHQRVVDSLNSLPQITTERKNIIEFQETQIDDRIKDIFSESQFDLYLRSKQERRLRFQEKHKGKTI